MVQAAHLGEPGRLGQRRPTARPNGQAGALQVGVIRTHRAGRARQARQLGVDPDRPLDVGEVVDRQLHAARGDGDRPHGRHGGAVGGEAQPRQVHGRPVRRRKVRQRLPGWRAGNEPGRPCGGPSRRSSSRSGAGRQRERQARQREGPSRRRGRAQELPPRQASVPHPVPERDRRVRLQGGAQVRPRPLAGPHQRQLRGQPLSQCVLKRHGPNPPNVGVGPAGPRAPARPPAA